MTTRCVSDQRQYYTDNIVNTNRKTTHSWPVICRQSKHYESDDEDYETVFTLNNNYQTNQQSQHQPDKQYYNSNDNLSYRKYLVADYSNSTNKQQTDFLSTPGAQNDYFNSKGSSSRLLGRNSIVPLMSQSHQQQQQQSQRRRTTIIDSATVSSIANAHHSTTNTTCSSAPPPILFLLATLLMTISATGMVKFPFIYN